MSTVVAAVSRAQEVWRDDEVWRRVGLAVGAGRIALGGVFWAAPGASVRVAGLDRDTAPRADWLARMTAGRDVAIGAGTLAAHLRPAAPAERGGWLLAGALADLGDTLAIGRGAREGRLARVPAALATLSAAGAAAAGTLAAVRGLRGS